MGFFSDPSIAPITGMFPLVFFLVFPFLRLTNHWNKELSSAPQSLKFKYVLTIGYLTSTSAPAIKMALYLLFNPNVSAAQLFAKGTERFSGGMVYSLYVVDAALGVLVYVLTSGVAAFNKDLTSKFLKVAPVIVVFNCVNNMLTFMFIERERYHKASDNVLFVIVVISTVLMFVIPYTLIIKFIRSRESKNLTAPAITNEFSG